MEKTIQTLRFLGIDMINSANSGHPGIVLGAAGTVSELFHNHLVAHPEHPDWFNRDRFFLAAGHGSALLYALLHLAGYNISIEDLKNFRQLDSKTPGHPEFGHTPGVDSTTGPLGQGLAMAVGNAIAESYLSAKFNRPDLNVIDHKTYVLCGDGDLQEGVTLEAMSIAGRLKLNKLVVLFDSNDIQLDGPTENATSDNIEMKVKSMNWNYHLVKKPNDLSSLAKTLEKAKNSDRPTFIEVKSIIGFGSQNQGTSSTHGSPVGNEEANAMRERMGYPYKPFEIAKEVYDDFANSFAKRGEQAFCEWEKTMNKYKESYLDEYHQLQNIINRQIDIDFDELIPQVDIGTKEATRNTIGKLISILSQQLPEMIGGSADLTSSTKVKGIEGDFDSTNRTGRNINFGVREHAMAAIINGLTLHHLKAFSGGFFVFSDYMKPAIRLSALMGIPSIFIFTHDSIAVGEDGPTHEPIEQLSMFRTTPNLNTFRPANANETRHAMRYALTSLNKPSVIVLTRQNTLVTHKVSYEQFKTGAYIISDPENFEGILIATGSEVELAISVKEILQKEHGIHVRVVSMPSMELFLSQPKEIQERIIPSKCKKCVAIEMGASLTWYRFANHVYGIDRFGKSGKGNEVMADLGFTTDQVVKYFMNL
ncbi:MAG TPA: transketolase [Bacillota bacterium]|nr:transketolase [Bacillota bacterium]